MRNPPKRGTRIPDGLYVYRADLTAYNQTNFLITVIASRPDPFSSEAAFDWYRCTAVLPDGTIIADDLVCAEELEEVDL